MSPSSAAIPTAVIIQAYQSSRVYATCGVATTVFFVYDHILCLGREYTFWLYIVVPLATIPPLSDTLFKSELDYHWRGGSESYRARRSHRTTDLCPIGQKEAVGRGHLNPRPRPIFREC
ncbi:hypothetical protein C2E23DRAFT_35675 [Lenzites betulinus]|nr:hypothetical protein C2E23DRAFT_35675 [Lenzites betulinus]